MKIRDWYNATKTADANDGYGMADRKSRRLGVITAQAEDRRAIAD